MAKNANNRLPNKKRDLTKELKDRKIKRKSLDLNIGVIPYFDTHSKKFHQKTGKLLMELLLNCLAVHADAQEIMQKITGIYPPSK